MENNEKGLNSYLLIIMAIASGITVANIYYIQPLLGEISQYFNVSQSYSGLMVTLTQVGYAGGLFFILPVADLCDKKKLVLIMLGLSIISLTCMILSNNFYISTIICVAIGATSIVPQLMIPFGAQMSKPEERGKNIGTIMSGLLIGMLCSRIISGLLGSVLTWKSVYMLAILLIVILSIVLLRMLPNTEKNTEITYINSLKSLFTLPKKYPVLISTSINGTIIFAILSAFWAVLTFHLSSDFFGYGSDIIGLFGLFGIVGAVFAPIAGKMTDKKGPNFTVFFHMIVIMLSIVILGLFKTNIYGISVGTTLINYGVQCSNVANQGRIQALSDIERNRITSVYMVCFFLGGALGSYVGTKLYEQFQWNGFIVMGAILILIAIILNMETSNKHSFKE